MSVKHGYYEQFYPQQPLSETKNFEIYFSEDYFIDLTSKFIDLYVTVKKSNSEKPIAAERLSYEKSVLNNLCRQLIVYINRTLVSTNTNLSDYSCYIQFMLMTPMSYKLLIGMAIGQ